MKNTKITKSKYFISGIIVSGLLIGTGVFASTTGAGTIGSLFKKVGSDYRLMGDNIENGTVDSSEIEDDTIKSIDIKNESLTSSDLAENSVGNSELNNSETFSMNKLQVAGGRIEGRGIIASGEYSKASGEYSIAMGYKTLSSGKYSIATGIETIASGTGSFAMGYRTEASGEYSTSMGYDAEASGDRSTVIGNNSEASGGRSIAMGQQTEASGDVSTAMGYNSVASGDVSTAIGSSTKASGKNSIAMGQQTEASGHSSIAMGYYAKVSGYSSIAMGGRTEASGDYSTAMGYHTEASGDYSTAMGMYAKASGYSSTAMGYGTEASGSKSTAMGYKTKASTDYSTIVGKNGQTASDDVFAVAYGDGADEDTAGKGLVFQVNRDGDVKAKGKIYSDGKEVALKGDTLNDEFKYIDLELLRMKLPMVSYAESIGSRDPADKISNYLIVNDSNLIKGKKYGYLLFTSGERKGKRKLSDGTVITSKCYNSGVIKNDIEYNYIGEGESGIVMFTRQGTFNYNPSTIKAGDGSEGDGYLIVKNTYECSDPGKGGAWVYVYEYDDLKNILDKLKERTGNSAYTFRDRL